MSGFEQREYTGDCPVGWRRGRLKLSVASSKNGVWGSEPDGVNDLPCVRVADFDRVQFKAIGAPTLRAIEPSERAGRVLQRGDLLLEKSGGGEKTPVGAVVLYVSNEPAVCSNFVARIVLRQGTEPRFMTYVHASLYATGVTTRSIKQSTGIQNLDADSYFNETVLYPPLEMQQNLADFLDRKTAAIDVLIAKKERLIDLLQEKRQALITQAVTKGLDPNVPMKDSGVEWLGEIPAHWEVKRIKFVCRLESGHTPSKTEPSYWIEEECVIPWVSLNDTKTLERSDYIEDTAVKISTHGMANSSAHLIPAGAVVFNRDGARVGLAAITTRPMAVSQHIIAWVCGPTITPGYLLHVIYAMQNELVRLTSGATIPTIGMGDVRELAAPIPPLSEQQHIVTATRRSLELNSNTRGRVERQLELLREYRQALITEAVTGKLDIPAEPA